MTYQSASPKVRSEHLQRGAWVYIRQSTLYQVRENTASTARQYDFAETAYSLGWSRERIIIVDQDQGRSGTSMDGREGFKIMLAEISLGNVGAVLSLEASRLARDGGDWHHLLKLCDMADTLIIDETGVYDPRDPGDRLMLGIKGALSEAERYTLRTRLDKGKSKAAQQGKLRLHLPVGLVYNAAGRIVIDPDERVQSSLRYVFRVFDEATSAKQVIEHFNEKNLKFPMRHLRGVRRGEVEWVRLRYGHLLVLLHNPLYAGAYVYGRTKATKRPCPEDFTKVKLHRTNMAMEDWTVLTLDNHVGYITWDKYLRNVKKLEDNRNVGSGPGAARSGAALLQGIVTCGRCRRPMYVNYPHRREQAYYICNTEQAQYKGSVCQLLSGTEIDRAVVQAVFQAIQPANLEMSMRALDFMESQSALIESQWRLRLENAQYDADLAHRFLKAGDPEYRLTYQNLQRDWEEKLEIVERLKREYANAPRLLPPRLSHEDRQAVLALAEEVPTVWHADTTTQVERKQVLRLLIERITLTRVEMSVQIDIRWHTGTNTRCNIRLKTSGEAQRTDANLLDVIRELAREHDDRQIAMRLNKLGLTTKNGKPFTRNRVGALRFRYKILNAKSPKRVIEAMSINVGVSQNDRLKEVAA